MTTHLTTIRRQTTDATDIIDITDDVQAAVQSSGVNAGMVVVAVAGSTASITTIEYESGAVEDLRKAIDRLAPASGRYSHDARWGDGNGYAHVRAALLGPSLCLPIVHARASLGTWQQIVLCDFDNKGRRREVIVQVVGE